MTIYEKLNKIQSELKAPKNQRNNFGNYNYRSCEDILEALKPLLSEVKAVLIIKDKIELIGNRYYVKATATLQDCESKENIKATARARETENKKGMDESQITGASSSYARKYALNGLFLIDDTKDADTMDNTKKEVKKETKEDKFVKDLNQDLINDITKKVKELNPDIKKEEFKSFIKEKTSEDFETKNLNNIINKLDILISERK
jgi:hypothetical protein